MVAGGYSGREIEEERGERRERIDMILGYIIFYSPLLNIYFSLSLSLSLSPFQASLSHLSHGGGVYLAWVMGPMWVWRWHGGFWFPDW